MTQVIQTKVHNLTSPKGFSMSTFKGGHGAARIRTSNKSDRADNFALFRHLVDFWTCCPL